MKSKELSFMRQLILKSLPLVLFLLLAGKVQSSMPDPFITTWQTDGNNNIIIPLTGDGYDFSIDWGDGTIEYKDGTPGDITHTYTTADVYTVSIMPNTFDGFPRIYLNSFENSTLLLEIKQWGGGQWSSMNQSFSGASNLHITATDVPDLSSVTDLSYMFYNASSLNSDLSGWNVSNVTNMSAMFSSTSNFNGDLSGWNVSNVTDMSYMFNSASSFNRNLSTWNVGSINNMSNMFSGAQSFNGNISTWNVGNVIDMSYMFYSASSFNRDLRSWNVSNVTDMSYMFNNASAFNSALGSWNVSNVTNINSMFSDALAFDQDLSTWNIASVTNASNFLTNGKLSLANYDALLLGWNNLGNQIPASLNIDFGNSKYSDMITVNAARTNLIETHHWAIIDYGISFPPLISSTSLTLNNSTIKVTFSERVYSDINGASDLETADFSLAIDGGRATLSSVTPISITTTDNISFILGIELTGKPDGAETLTVSPAADAIYNLARDVASTTQSNQSVLLYEALLSKNGQIGATDATYVDKQGKTGSNTGLNAAGKSIVTRSTEDLTP